MVHGGDARKALQIPTETPNPDSRPNNSFPKASEPDRDNNPEAKPQGAP
jgi:hypothetical protein